MRLAAACGIVVAWAFPLQAQEASVLVGGSQVRYADSLDGTAASVAARIAAGRGLRAGIVDAAVARFLDGGWALQVGARGTVLWPLGTGRTSVGFAAGAVLNDYEGGLASGTGAVGPLVAVSLGRSEAVLGMTGGGYRSIDGVWAALATGSLGWHWVPAAPLQVDASVAGSRADTLMFADATLQLRATVSRLRLGALGGVRAGDLADGPWGSIDVAWDVAGPITLEAAAGRYPQDLTGFADGLYAQLGLRIHAVRRAPVARPLTVTRTGEGVRLIIRYRPKADRLFIAGDWNGWVPQPMVSEGDGRWRLDMALAPGIYTFALVDGERWVLPDGVRPLDDGFGGSVGQFTVRAQ